MGAHPLWIGYRPFAGTFNAFDRISSVPLGRTLNGLLAVGQVPITLSGFQLNRVLLAILAQIRGAGRWVLVRHGTGLRPGPAAPLERRVPCGHVNLRAVQSELQVVDLLAVAC